MENIELNMREASTSCVSRGVFRTAAVTAVLLFVPAIELIALRLFLKFGLKVKIGFIGTTDFDYIVSVPLAVFLFVSALESVQPVVFQFRRKAAALNLALVCAFIAVNVFVSRQPAGAEFPYLLWGGLLFLLVTSSFGVFVPFSYFWRNPHRLVFVPCFLITFLFPIFMHMPETVWSVFGSLTGSVVSWVFAVFFDGAADVGFSKYGHLSLKHPVHNMLIGKGCGGAEGQLLFLLTFSVFASIHRLGFSAPRIVLAIVLGMLLMFAANIVRLVLLFWIGVGLKTVFEYDLGLGIFKFVAHAHIGWLLYAGTLSGFFTFLYWHMRGAETPRAQRVLPLFSDPLLPS